MPDPTADIVPLQEQTPSAVDVARLTLVEATRTALTALSESIDDDTGCVTLHRIQAVAAAQEQALAQLGAAPTPRVKGRRPVMAQGYGSGYGAAMSHETQGAKVIKEVLAMATKIVASNSLPGLVQAAASAKDAGFADLATELEGRARKALSLVDDATPVVEKVSELIEASDDASGGGAIAASAEVNLPGGAFIDADAPLPEELGY